MIIGFSLGALRNSDWTLIKKIKFMKEIGANAVEIPFRDPDTLLNFNLSSDLIEALRSFDYLSLHAPFSAITYKKGELTDKIIRKLKEITSSLPVKSIVVHPNNVEDFSLLEKSALPILIENMDFRKNSFKNEREIKNIFDNYDFKFVLDLEHSFENDPSLNLTKNLIKIMGDRLVEIHLSGAKKSSEINENNHGFITKSTFGEKICSSLATLKNIPIILEVDAERNKEISLKEEINYIKKNHDNSNT